MDDVSHMRGDDAVDQERALDQRRPGPPAQAELLRDVPRRRRLLHLQVANGQGLALAARERRIGLEDLKPGAERGRHRHPADERAAALAPQVLAVRLEPLQGEAQGAAGDPQRLGQLLLRRQAVTGTGAAGRQPLAEGGLRDVDERGRGHRSSLSAVLHAEAIPAARAAAAPARSASARWRAISPVAASSSLPAARAAVSSVSEAAVAAVNADATPAADGSREVANAASASSIRRLASSAMLRTALPSAPPRRCRR